VCLRDSLTVYAVLASNVPELLPFLIFITLSVCLCDSLIVYAVLASNVPELLPFLMFIMLDIPLGIETIVRLSAVSFSV
jgi:hypothetical protein